MKKETHTSGHDSLQTDQLSEVSGAQSAGVDVMVTKTPSKSDFILLPFDFVSFWIVPQANALCQSMFQSR